MGAKGYGFEHNFITFAIVIYVLLVIAIRSGCLGPIC